jgi:TRL (tRNA-associated locus)-like protein
MKKFKLLCLVGVIAVLPLLIGCATPYPIGMVYTKLTLPVSCESDAQSIKTGTSECLSVLGIVAIGDISFEEAMQNGNITKVNHADWDVENTLGVVGKYKLTVYGE